MVKNKQERNSPFPLPMVKSLSRHTPTFIYIIIQLKRLNQAITDWVQLPLWSVLIQGEVPASQTFCPSVGSVQSP